MSFDLKMLDVKSNTAFTQYELEAERRREVLTASSRAAGVRRAVPARPSRLSALGRSVGRFRAPVQPARGYDAP
jgi:hypothetical protein